MPIDPEATVVPERLRSLQARHRLTIQEMADRCALPKRSLENYMRSKDPQKPGLDALIAISDGFNVSLDWIIGRSNDGPEKPLEPRDYAICCYTVVLALLDRLIREQEMGREVIDTEKRTLMAIDPHALAAAAAVDFIEVVNRMKEFRTHHEFDSASDFERLRSMARAEAPLASYGKHPSKTP